ncbi:MAG: hypothetical protein P8M12_07740 [Flavobacteriales bacterium]|nr:hypothetical protein [Flavobacteriales bacterium]
MKEFDVILLTESCYENPKELDQYVQNVITEDGLVKNALEDLGCRVKIVPWDKKDFNWSSAYVAIFRTTWDYFHRFKEFNNWLISVKEKIQLVNSYQEIMWNLDKHYLKELSEKNINIPSSHFIPKKTNHSLSDIMDQTNWNKIVLKPTISGGARHTFKITKNQVSNYEDKFKELIKHEDFMIQEFQDNILTKGEISFMLFGGKYSHAVRKMAKKGDFRVQDDFGGSVHQHQANAKEISFAENVISVLEKQPIYARVDVIWDNNNELAVSELELIEPELWFRFKPESAQKMAHLVFKKLNEIKNI